MKNNRLKLVNVFILFTIAILLMQNFFLVDKISKQDDKLNRVIEAVEEVAIDKERFEELEDEVEYLDEWIDWLYLEIVGEASGAYIEEDV